MYIVRIILLFGNKNFESDRLPNLDIFSGTVLVNLEFFEQPKSTF